MTTIIENDLQRFFAVAGNGAVAQAAIVPVQAAVTTNLRVTYNWLYSSLNCDAGDSTTFLWTFVKLDDTHVALSPSQPFDGMTLYASVRPDIGYGVQVQAPYSADWITAIGGDETITLNLHQLLLASFQGLNGGYLTVNSSPDQHDDHTGYRLFSTGGTEALFVLQSTTSLQPGLEFRQTIQWTPDRLQEALRARGASLPDEPLHRVVASLS